MIHSLDISGAEPPTQSHLWINSYAPI